MNPGAEAEASDSKVWLKKVERHCYTTLLTNVLKVLYFVQQKYIHICVKCIF